MSPEQQRIAIAKARGHTFEWQEDTGSLWVVAPNRLILDVRFPNMRSREETLAESGGALPDYLNDLNAMHEAEKGLTRDQLQEYVNLLWPTGYSVQEAITATAARRAEAFLKTLSLWTED